ncbi:MAG TPA: outer membrane beta-barrel protein [Gemmatimonadales bacterium]|nr:outer membrane beta-barrel protein [Gemmatimonadales bacterium]
MSSSSRAARAVAVACFAAVSVAAQGIHPQFGLGGGLTAPVGDYHATAGGQGFNTAWHGLALLAFKLPVFPLGFRIDLSYAANSANDRLKDTLSSALGQPTDEKTKLAGASINLTYQSAAAHLKPYAIAGVGLYHTTISISTSESTADRAATKLAWNVGGGVALALRGVTLFFETRYVNVAAVSGFPRTTFLPFTTGIRFGGR